MLRVQRPLSTSAVHLVLTLLSCLCLCSQEPTGAATVAQMEAIVVSRETIKGANEINAWRAEHGSRPLTVVVVDLVGNQGSSGSNKLSSTRLRQEEAQKPPS